MCTYCISFGMILNGIVVEIIDSMNTGKGFISQFFDTDLMVDAWKTWGFSSRDLFIHQFRSMTFASTTTHLKF